MLNKETLIEDGLTPESADHLIDAEALCETRYLYATTHPDAANAYDGLFDDDEQFDHLEFTDAIDPPEPSIYLGQDEVEIQLPKPLTDKERYVFNLQTDYFVAGIAQALAYRLYPWTLSVVPVYEKAKR